MLEGFNRVHGGPLKGRNGFGHEGVQTDGDLTHVALAAAGPEKAVFDALDHFHQFGHVRIDLRGQTDHEIDLEVGDAGGHQGFGGLEDLCLAKSFIDYPPQAFRSGVRGDGGGAGAALFQGFDQRAV